MSLAAEAQNNRSDEAGQDYDFDIQLDALDLEAMRGSAEAAEQVTMPEQQHPSDPLDMDELIELDELSGLDALNANALDDRPKGVSKNKANLIIVVGVVCIVAMLGGLGLVATKILPGKSGQVHDAGRVSLQQQAQASQGQVSPEQASGQAQDPALASIETAKAIDSAFSGVDANPIQVEQAAPVGQATSAESEQMKNLIVTYNPDDVAVQSVTAEAQVVQPVSGDVQSMQPAQAKPDSLTAEDKLYDDLLRSVDGMDVPPEAIKIDETVVKRKLEAQRLSTMEQELRQARASVAEVKGAVDSMKAQLNGFAQVIEKNSADQAKMSESISKLADSVAAANAQHERDLKELKSAIAAAEKRAKNAESTAREAKSTAQKGATREVVVREVVKQAPPTPAPSQVAPVMQQPAQVAAPQPQANVANFTVKAMETIPQPKTVIAPVQADAAASSVLPSHCDGSRVSANWKVKGVNSQSAYVVRPQDKQGMYLKVGVEVPGYGQVQAFDPGSRSVCTTNGLIRR